MCGKDPDGRWHCTVVLRLRADALRRLGLHPEQPTSAAFDPPPRWWHRR